MQSSRNKQRSRRARRTHHKKAFTNSQTVERLSYLTKHWKKLDGIDRGDRLRALVEAGCTRRGLAHDLHRSPTTISRHIEIAGLHQSEKYAIRQGASAKVALHKRANARWLDFCCKQVAYEKSSEGEVSDYAAQVISDFLVDPKQKLKIGPGDIQRLLEEVNLKYRYGFAWTGMQRRSYRITDPRKIIRACRPARPQKNVRRYWFDLIAEWVARIADSLTQVESIRDKALAKVEALAKKGFGDRIPRPRPNPDDFNYPLHPKR